MVSSDNAVKGLDLETKDNSNEKNNIINNWLVEFSVPKKIQININNMIKVAKETSKAKKEKQFDDLNAIEQIIALNYKMFLIQDIKIVKAVQ